MAKQRFVALDGLRGVAAVAVVLYHIGTASGSRWLVPRGYLAVDFFFVLSGFVLAHAYGERLTSGGMTARAFLVARYRRLWPIALLGATIGLAVSLSTRDGAALRQSHGFALATALNLFLLPNIAPGIASLYPLNPPHWSLLYELVANFGYGIGAPMLRPRVLAGFLILSACGLAETTVRAHGGGSLSLWRVAYSFFIGVAIYRVWMRGIRPSTSLLALALILAAAMLAPTGPYPALVDGTLTLVVFPLIVWHGASTATPDRVQRVARLCGAASYPLYALHYPFIMLMF